MYMYIVLEGVLAILTLVMAYLNGEWFSVYVAAFVCAASAFLKISYIQGSSYTYKKSAYKSVFLPHVFWFSTIVDIIIAAYVYLVSYVEVEVANPSLLSPFTLLAPKTRLVILWCVFATVLLITLNNLYAQWRFYVNNKFLFVTLENKLNDILQTQVFKYWNDALSKNVTSAAGAHYTGKALGISPEKRKQMKLDLTDRLVHEILYGKVTGQSLLFEDEDTLNLEPTEDASAVQKYKELSAADEVHNRIAQTFTNTPAYAPTTTRDFNGSGYISLAVNAN